MFFESFSANRVVRVVNVERQFLKKSFGNSGRFWKLRKLVEILLKLRKVVKN